MKLMDFLIEDAIEPEMKSTTKADSVRELVALLKRAGAITDRNKIAEIVLEREEMGTTGTGEGIALPHGKSDAVSKLAAAFGRSKRGIDFESVDNQPVHLFFLLIAPTSAATENLMALARMARLLKNRDFRRSLMDAEDKAAILEVLTSEP